MMSEPFVGQIIPVGFSFAPVGWLLCDGSLLSIDEYQVLYTLIGTTYGGDGASTFGLPNLCGRVAMTAGQGGGLQPYVQGQAGGSEAVTLNTTQLGNHVHLMVASSQDGTTNVPSTSAVLSNVPKTSTEAYGPSVTGVAMAASAISAAGGSAAHENRQPFLTVNYIIAYAGVFPSQS
jgi:microcystin-dependent protein